MVKNYDRWGPTQAFGIVCSGSATSIYDGKLAYVPALEDVLVWDVKKGQMVRVSCQLRAARRVNHSP